MTIDLNTEMDALRDLAADVDYGDISNKEIINKIESIVENLQDIQAEIDDIKSEEDE